MPGMIGSASIDVYDAVGDLDPSEPLGQPALVRNPPSLYIYTSSGYQLLAASTPTGPSTPASESGLGTVELATASEIESGTAGVLVATAARLKAELDRRKAGDVASETAQGIVELATTAEAQAGTLTGANAMNPARTKEAKTQQALTLAGWTAPTLLNSWVNFGAPHEVAGYRKLPTNEVQLRGLIKNGTTTNRTVLFTLPVGYRPANTRRFPSVQGGGAACVLLVASNGEVTINAVSDNTYLGLDGVRFDV